MPVSDVNAAIEKLTKELVMRERAAAHLRGLPARHNQTAIDDLYDRLNALHIARIEGRPTA